MIIDQLAYRAKYRLRSIMQVAAPSRKGMTAAALQLLESKLPGSWLLRIVAQQPTGLDALLEIAEEGNPLDGQSAWIQLRVERRISWSRTGRYTAGPIEASPLPDQRVNSGPAFLFLADLSRGEVYFLCQDTYIQEHYESYLRKGSLSYSFDRKLDIFSRQAGPLLMALQLQQQLEKQQLTNLMTIFLTDISGPCGSDMEEEQIVERLYAIRGMLGETFAYWSFTQPAFYYLVHSITCRALHRYGYPGAQ